MQVAETWRYRCHRHNSRATRKPIALTLGRKLHDEIGYSLRKYQRLSACRHDSVQLLTRSFLKALQLRICCSEGTSGHWLAKHDDDARPVPRFILSEPPGLERRAKLSWDSDDDIEVLGNNASSPICDKSRAEATYQHAPKASQTSCSSSEAAEDWAQDLHLCSTPPPRPRDFCSEFLEANSEKCARDSGSQGGNQFYQKPAHDEVGLIASRGCGEVENFKLNILPSDPSTVVRALREPAPQPVAVPLREAPGSGSEDVQSSAEATQSSLKGLLDLRNLTVMLDGDGFSTQQQRRLVQQLVGGASQAMISKGFDSIKDGIKIDKIRGASSNTFQLSFPDAISAIAFYKMFDDYHWESDNYRCLVVRLSSREYHSQLNSPLLTTRFATPDAITPAKVYEILHTQ